MSQETMFVSQNHDVALLTNRVRKNSGANRRKERSFLSMSFFVIPLLDTPNYVLTAPFLTPTTMTQEERREQFYKKALVGNRRNNAALSDCNAAEWKYNQHQLTLNEAFIYAWECGCEYGKDHAEELKIFDK